MNISINDMDSVKLTEAAEESRRTSAQSLTTFGTYHYIDDVVAVTDMRLSYDEVAESSFEKGAEWLMKQPLSERLTDDEKEKIRTIYTRNVYVAEDVERKFTEECLLEAIFGKELFSCKL